MPGKTVKAKKKVAKGKKLVIEEKNRAKKVVKVLASKEEEVVTNNAEPEPPKVNEDIGKYKEIEASAEEELPMQTLEDNVRELEAKEAALNTTGEEKTCMSKMGIAPVPFDPASVVANILKKKE